MSHHYSKDQRDLTPSQRADTVVFDYLLNAIRPKVLIVHGNLPIRHLERILKVCIKKDEFVSHKLNDFTLDIIAAKVHFSRVSREYLRDFGTRVKNHVGASAIAHRI
ncbi:hypothetical protein Poly51_61390 [Rubripirellula tenax]|uniref:Uncharacterized protein n=2 Tax=Rubripirellula tenax TaxID=2528015 RepID=A0A5C6E471_9BACT|nr:hypothetical protein Poly51_61390 [Rubripirellula tenax]